MHNNKETININDVQYDSKVEDVAVYKSTIDEDFLKTYALNDELLLLVQQVA